MERNQLRYVIEVAKWGNITKAAEKLHLSQPSLSNQIIHLEKELGISLFERTRKRIYLTEAGENFVLQAKGILGDLDLLRQTMSDYALQHLGKIRIGALSIMVPLGFPNMISSFSEQYPSLEITLLESGSTALLTALKQNEIDAALAILPTYFEDPEIHSIKIMESRLMAVINRSNPLSKLESLPLASLKDQKLVITAENFTLQKLIISSLEHNGIPYKISTVCNQIESCIALADKNFGISFCSEQLVNYYNYSNLVYLPIETIPSRLIYLLYKKNPDYHPVIKSFLEFVTDYYHIETPSVSK